MYREDGLKQAVNEMRAGGGRGQHAKKAQFTESAQMRKRSFPESGAVAVNFRADKDALSGQAEGDTRLNRSADADPK